MLVKEKDMQENKPTNCLKPQSIVPDVSDGGGIDVLLVCCNWLENTKKKI